MRDYETVFVLHPSYEDKEVEAEILAITGVITASGGSMLEIDRWGRRRLAYEIKKAHEGIYTLIRWQGSALAPRDLDRRFRLNERMLRYMTVISEGPLLPPKLETEVTAHPAEGVPVGAEVESEQGVSPATDTAPAPAADGASSE